MTAAKQNAMADEAGVPKRARYVEKNNRITELRAEAIASMRRGDGLWVADATVLAENQREFRALILGSGPLANVALHEGRTGHVSEPPHAGAKIVIEAYARWASSNKTFGAMTAEEAGSIGGKKAARRHRKERMPKSMAGPIWYDKKLMHMSTDEIVAHINKVGREQGFTKEWNKDSLYRTFKGRGIPAGPKAQLKK